MIYQPGMSSNIYICKTYFAWVLSASFTTLWLSMHQITAFTSPPFSWRFGFIWKENVLYHTLSFLRMSLKVALFDFSGSSQPDAFQRYKKKLHEESNIWIKYLGVCSWPGLSMYISPVSLSSTSCRFWVQGLALVSSPSGQSVDLVMMLTVVDFPVLVDPTIITQAFGLIFGFSFSGFSFLSLIESPILAWICSVPLSPKTSEDLRHVQVRRPNTCLKKLPLVPTCRYSLGFAYTAGCSVNCLLGLCFPAGNPIYPHIRHWSLIYSTVVYEAGHIKSQSNT